MGASSSPIGKDSTVRLECRQTRRVRPALSGESEQQFSHVVAQRTSSDSTVEQLAMVPMKRKESCKIRNRDSTVQQQGLVEVDIDDGDIIEDPWRLAVEFLPPNRLG